MLAFAFCAKIIISFSLSRLEVGYLQLANFINEKMVIFGLEDRGLVEDQSES